MARLAAALAGPVVVRKGPTDWISDGHTCVANTEPGCLKRCGGQGDVLAGSIAVAYLAGSLGRMAELDRPLLRVTSAGVGALVFGSWLLFVDFVRVDEARGSGALAFGAVGLHLVWAPLITALTTAMVAFSIWPMLRALPGLRRLERSVF